MVLEKRREATELVHRLRLGKWIRQHFAVLNAIDHRAWKELDDLQTEVPTVVVVGTREATVEVEVVSHAAVAVEVSGVAVADDARGQGAVPLATKAMPGARSPQIIRVRFLVSHWSHLFCGPRFCVTNTTPTCHLYKVYRCFLNTSWI